MELDVTGSGREGVVGRKGKAGADTGVGRKGEAGADTGVGRNTNKVLHQIAPLPPPSTYTLAHEGVRMPEF